MNTSIVVAFFSEAKPIIERLKLKELPAHAPFRLFRSSTTTLIVSGLGKIAIASACGYLHSQNQELCAWLNIGVAGHRSASVGQPFIANKILDVANGQTWYPPQVLSTKIPPFELHTVDVVEHAYPDDVGYDLEGAAFYACASRFNTSELVQCVKIISDNLESPTSNVNKDQVHQIIQENIDDIVTVINGLSNLAENLPKPAEIIIDPYLEQTHFTHAQKQQLRSLLERFKVIGIVPRDTSKLTDSHIILQSLQSQLLGAPVRFA